MEENKEYTIEYIKSLQERLDVLIKKAIDMLCELKPLELNEDEKNDIINTSPLEYDIYLCEKFFNTPEYMFDPDSSLTAWKYYYIYYKDYFNSNIPNEEAKEKLWHYNYPNNPYKRYHMTFDYNDGTYLLKPSNTEDLKENQNIGIAGDCCFNFNDDKVKKISYIIRKEENYFQIMSLVYSCYKMHHSLLNFALMPSSGDLNIFKGTDNFDRLTYLLHYIIKFCDEGCGKIFSTAKHDKPKKALKDFLSIIEAKEIKYYQIFYPELKYDEKLYDGLLKNGQKETLKTTADILEYIELAIRFWETKDNYYKKQIQQAKTTK